MHVATPSSLGTGRVLGQPSAARLALFARHDGPAVLLTTDERLQLFADAHLFGASVSTDPDLADWAGRRDKVVLTLRHALQRFPEDPEELALELRLGADIARDALLERLLAYGFERDALPGFTVRGDTVALYPDADDPDDELRLSFFGTELDGLTRRGQPVESAVIGPLPGAPLDRSGWTSRLLEHLPGTVFLDVPELFAGELGDDDETHRLWHALGQRSVVSFGRDPLELPSATVPLEPLGYYRGKLRDVAADVETWVRDGYTVHVLLKFERTGRYLREKVVEHLSSAWHARVEEHPGEVSLVLGRGARGGYRDPERREVVLSEELLYGYQGGRRLGKLPGRRVHDASQLTVGDYLIHPDHGIGRFLGLEPRQVVGVTRDYLQLQYAGEGKLYLPVEQLPLLRRHPGTTDDPPRLSTLGTNEWARARERARVSAQELAAELIKTSAARQVSQGTAYPPVPDW
ncbi:MAG: CarD family transcriptional regulator, partial [Deinococcales bacterium]